MASTTSQTDMQVPDAPGSDTRLGRAVYLRYLLWAIPLPLLVWASAFFLVCSKGFERWDPTQWGATLEFPFAANAPNADVVIFGDSSAFLGIDPRILNARLGIRSVVLPGTVGSLPVIGDLPLRSYLAHHPRPALLVLYLSPWNLDFDHMAPARLFEGQEMLFRHGTAGEILRYNLRHPMEFIVFPLRLYSTFGSRMIKAMLHGKSREVDTAARLGHAPYTERFGPLDNLCELPSGYLKSAGMQTVEAMRARYAAQGIPVMVYMAPVPRCANASAFLQRSYGALNAEAPALLPPTLFADDTFYAHIRPAEVMISTDDFAAALKRRLASSDPQLLGRNPAAMPPPDAPEEDSLPTAKKPLSN